MMRLIRLVGFASSPVPSDADETKMNWEKHEGSLLLVSSDGSSILPASTTIFHSLQRSTWPACWRRARTGDARLAAEAGVQRDGHKTSAIRARHPESEAG